jgi:hypothetical protein
VSHYLLDVIVHEADLPLAGNDSPKLGLGLWNHFGLSVALELVVLAAGAVAYATLKSRRHPVRPARLTVVLVVLLGVYAAAILGPPPPSVTAVGAADIVFLLVMVALGAWADKAASPARMITPHAAR